MNIMNYSGYVEQTTFGTTLMFKCGFLKIVGKKRLCLHKNIQTCNSPTFKIKCN